MSGIFGCWHLDGRAIDAADLDRGLRQISPTGNQNHHSWAHSVIALGCKSAAQQERNGLAVDRRDNATACAFDGRIDNRDALIRCLSADPSVSPQSSDAELALAAYHRFGDACAEQIEGDFAFGVFDRRADRLLLVRDRLGLRPLCYSRTGRAFLFASEAKALLAYPGMRAEPDDVALADFVLYFNTDGSERRTFFNGIDSVPPAHMLIATPHGVSLRRYFDFNPDARIRFRTAGEYGRALHERVRESVRARLRCARPVAITVSGGLDSAYIFCIAQAAIREGTASCPAVSGINYAGDAGTPAGEEDYVRELERATGASIERVPQRSGFMACAASEVWHSESPIVEGLASQTQAALRRLSAAGAGRLLTGHWGDQMLSDSDYVVDLLRAGRIALLRQHCRAWKIDARRLAGRVVRDLAVRRLPRRLLTAARAARGARDDFRDAVWYTPRFRRLLRERASQPSPPRRAGSRHAAAIYRQARLGYHVRCMEWNARMAAMHGLDVAFPYLDAALVQFLMAIPGEMQSLGGVPRGLMRLAMRGIVPDTIVERRTKGEFTWLANQSIEDDFSAIGELFGPAAVSVTRGYVDGAMLSKLLPEWRAAIRRADDALLTNRIVDLCGFELLLRTFFSTAEAALLDEQASLATC